MIPILWVSWQDCVREFFVIDCVVIVLVRNWNDASKIQDLDVVSLENFFELLSIDFSFVLVIKETEALFHVERLVAKEDLLGNLDLPLVFQDELE